MKNTTVKALVLVAEWVALRVKLSCTRSRAKRLAMLSRFDRKITRN